VPARGAYSWLVAEETSGGSRMRNLLKILLVPAAFGLMGGAANAAPGNVAPSAPAKATDADANATQIHYRRGYWHGHRHWRHRHYGYRHYYRPYRYYYRPYGYYYRPRPYYYRPYYRHRPRVRFHLGIGY
jgi:hypothetical protein